MSPNPSGPEHGALILTQVAEIVGGRLVGDASVSVVGVAPLDAASDGHIAPLTSRRYLKFVPTCRASAFLTTPEMESHAPDDRPRVVVDDPSRALMALLHRLYGTVQEPAGVHPTAILGRGVRLGVDVGVGPYAVLGDGVEVGAGGRIGAHVVVGAGSRLGAGCVLHPQSVLYPGTVLGDRVILHAGVRVGGDGFGYVFMDGGHRRIPHVGRVVVGSDVEVGPNSTIDRGSVGDTVIGDGVKIDNLVMVAHNVRVGRHSMLAAQVGIAGSTRVGEGVWLGGQAGAINHLDIGDGARIAVAAKVMKDVPSGDTMSGHPARSHRDDLSRQAHLSRLPKLAERVKTLEAELAALKRELGR